MGFKEDADFVRYLTMGAVAAKAVTDDLTKRGHIIVELERHAKANKVWSIKVKRLRMPDLLCLRCGRRFESKGKSKLELKLSHSQKPGRRWHDGGMRDNDVFSFVRVVGTDLHTETGRPIYVTLSSLREAAKSLQNEARKAFSDGAESAVKWPAWSPSYSGTVISITREAPRASGTEVAISVSGDDGRLRNYRARWPSVYTYLQEGDHFDAGDIVAGTVAPADVMCEGDIWLWEKDLCEGDRDAKYAAIKAARYAAQGSAEAKLRSLADDERVDWRLRLEALGALAAAKPDQWVRALADWASDTTAPDEEQMEGVFVLGELGHPAAIAALAEIASIHEQRNSEVRAAAVWMLGLGANAQSDRVANYLDDKSDLVVLHAAAVLPRVLSAKVLQKLLTWLADGTLRQAATAAHVLARRGYVDELIKIACNKAAIGHLFAIRALGDLPAKQVEPLAIPFDLRQLLRPLWAQHSDWLRRSENHGMLTMLEMQRVQF